MIWYIIGIVVLLGLAYVMLNNSAIRKHERVLKTWSDIDVILIQRNDQIKQQLHALFNAMDKESKAYSDISAARSGIANYEGKSINEKIAINNSLTGFIRGLRQEAYPEFQTFGTQMTHILNTWDNVEQELRTKRLAYNRSASMFNTSMKTIPDKWFAVKARMMGSEDGSSEPFALIVASESERKAVSIPEPNWN